MTTPNGQHPADPNGAAKQATSTVLALDGWGPVVPDSVSNGANGSEPEVAIEIEPMIESAPPRAEWRESIRMQWTEQLPRPTIDPQLLRILAPAAAMVIAVVVAIRFGSAWRIASVPSPEPEPEPPDQWTLLRRRIALAVDPSLAPIEPQRRGLLDLIPW